MAENNGVAILTDAYWRQRLDADPNVLGRDVLVNGIPRKIVGVLPADFRFLSSEARLFLPIRSRPEEHAPSQRHSGGGGRHLDYFLAFGIPPREGRFLNAEDSRRPERVCVVDEDFARRYWPRGGGGGALGQQVFHPGITYTGKSTVEEGETFTIVGVVGTVKQAELTEAQGQGAVYLPYAYRGNASIFVVTRTGQNPEAFAETLRKLVRAAHPELAFDNIRSMDTRIAESLIARRSPALLAGIFAGVALLLAAIGTYGVLSYAVAQRTREIGIRMALGAQRGQIGTQFLSLGLRLLAAGTILGLIGAWLAGRAMQSVLFDVPTLPVAALFGTALVLGVVSLVACLIPARRATRVDPIVALREG